MLVRYYLLNDKTKEFNAFNVIPSSQELTVGDIKQQIPVKGNLYLRFKTLLQDENPPIEVWLDGLDDFAPVPTYKDQILIKILFLPPYDTSFSSPPNKKRYKEFSHKEPKPQIYKATPPLAPKKPNDFLFMEENNHAKHPERSHSAARPNPVEEFKFPLPADSHFRFPSQPDPQKKPVDPTGGLSTEQLKKRAEDKIIQKVAEKTEDVKKIWASEANLRQEKQDAEKEFSEKLNNWESRNCQKNNIRALLATMHNVLWKDSGWEPMSAGDLITPAQVKAGYFKSLNIIHPDKHQKDPPHIRYIAERVFSAVNEAFKQFRNTS